jgi:hypothetical protein
MYYIPGPMTFTLEGITRELQRISQATYGAVPFLQFSPLAAAPDKPREGMVAYANGTNWNPGGTGAGLYVYVSGAWAKL